MKIDPQFSSYWSTFIFQSLYALIASIGATFFILFAMVVLNFEHSPMVGTVLGMMVIGYLQDAAIAIITYVILLVFISYYAKLFIRDLT
tara:strand:+ start:150 stop:416 length:267 start_codon:yes stop_codon:yes gene_type:complete